MRRPAKSQIAIALVLVTLATSGYGPCPSKNPLSTVEGVNKVEDKLGQVNNALNALAKTNRELYRNNVINPNERRTTATIINQVNGGLRKVGDRVYEIDPTKPDSITSGKIDVVALLNGINRELAKITYGPAELRLAAQAVVALVVEAIDLTNRIREVTHANTNQ